MAKGVKRAKDTDLVLEHMRSAAITYMVLNSAHATPSTPLTEGATFRSGIPTRLSYDEVEEGIRVTIGVIQIYFNSRLGRCDSALIKKLIVTLQWISSGPVTDRIWNLQNSVEVLPFDPEKHRFLPKTGESEVA